MAERTTVRLPLDRVRRSKHEATEQGRSLNASIEEGLRRVVDESRAATYSIRIIPRVSAAEGGLMRGIDLHDPACWESDDNEYVRRFF